MDSTPKRNLIFESQIPPRREVWSKSPGSHPEGNLGCENRKARDPEVGHQTVPPPPTTTTTTLTVLRPDGFAAVKNRVFAHLSYNCVFLPIFCRFLLLFGDFKPLFLQQRVGVRTPWGGVVFTASGGESPLPLPPPPSRQPMMVVQNTRLHLHIHSGGVKGLDSTVFTLEWLELVEIVSETHSCYQSN